MSLLNCDSLTMQIDFNNKYWFHTYPWPTDKELEILTHFFGLCSVNYKGFKVCQLRNIKTKSCDMDFNTTNYFLNRQYYILCFSLHACIILYITEVLLKKS
eukprot:GHVL01024105.1.p1 GENE.GHVL01024105.1~~GHVL01024105.1.p1  ORF type:complete len:101 (-),score=2.61 GHVL01024105.1:59-361(-)